MTNLADKFSTLEGLMADQNTAILTSLGTVNTTLAAIATALELLNENGAANTRYILNALGQIDPCKPCPMPSLVVPPLLGADPSADEDKCKRVQAFVHAVETILTYGDFMINGGVFASPGAINDMIAQAVVALGNPENPFPSWTEVVVIAADVASYIVNNLINGYSFVELFTPLKATLVESMFSGTTAESMRGIYQAVIGSNADPSYAVPVFNGVAYAALFNYYFDSGTSPDLTGYDGGICSGDDGCYHFSTDEMDFVTTETGSGYIPHWAKYGLTVVSNPGHDNAVWVSGDWDGWSFELDRDGVFHTIAGVFGSTGTEQSGTFSDPSPPNLLTFVHSEPFALVFCPPAV